MYGVSTGIHKYKYMRCRKIQRNNKRTNNSKNQGKYNGVIGIFGKIFPVIIPKTNLY